METVLFETMPSLNECWLDPTWVISREIMEMKISGFLAHCVDRSKMNPGLQFTTRVARIESGEDKGSFVGLLPLATQMLEWPENIRENSPLDKSFLGGKNLFKVPVTFVSRWFMQSDTLFVSTVTGEELGAELSFDLITPGDQVDLIPFLKGIFGDTPTFGALLRVPEMIFGILLAGGTVQDRDF